MEHASGSIRIVIINGGVRLPGNYASMASALVLHELTTSTGHDQSHRTRHVTAAAARTDPQSAAAKHLQQKVGGPRGRPVHLEYHGSFSSVMKLVIENLGFPSTLSGKPVTLLGIAGGTIRAVEIVGAFAQRRFACPEGTCVAAADFDRERQGGVRPRRSSLDQVLSSSSSGSARIVHLHQHECLSPVTLERLRHEGQQVSPKIICGASRVPRMVRWNESKCRGISMAHLKKFVCWPKTCAYNPHSPRGETRRICHPWGAVWISSARVGISGEYNYQPCSAQLRGSSRSQASPER